MKASLRWSQITISVSDVLMKATVDTLPNQECRRKWGRFSFIASENIFAGGIQADQCSGDSWGPLVVKRTCDIEISFRCKRVREILKKLCVLFTSH